MEEKSLLKVRKECTLCIVVPSGRSGNKICVFVIISWLYDLNILL